MTLLFRTYLQFALWMLIASLVFGLLATFAFLYPEQSNGYLPFYQLRPFHVSAALFWIISGATAGIMHYKNEVFLGVENKKTAENAFIVLWIITIIAVFFCYAFKKF